MARILIIDDDPGCRGALRRVLGTAGNTIYLAQDGAQGIEVLLAGEPVDLVITDLWMPEKDGIEALREIRSLLPDLPIIAMTGSVRPSGDATLRAAGLLGARELLRKPFEDAELLAAVQRALALPA